MRKIKDKTLYISASVSCMDMMHMADSMKEAEAAGIDFYHFDVVDGRFNQCFILGQTLLEAMRPQTELPIEVHLAVYEPELYIDQYVNAGADYICVHQETMKDPIRIFDQIEAAGAVPVLAYRAETPFKPEDMAAVKRAAWINKLTVNPGYSGQTLQPQAIDHIRHMREAIRASGLSTHIQADGNINPDTIPEVIDAGTDILTGGTSGLFNKNHAVEENIRMMKEAAKKPF